MLKSVKEKVALGTVALVAPVGAALAEGTNQSMLDSIDVSGLIGDISAAGGITIGITMAFLGVLMILRVLKRA